MSTTSRREFTSLNITTRDFETLPVPISLPQPPFLSIYSLFLFECHIILSIYNETLRTFPRFLRSTILFTLLYLQASLSCLAVSLWEKSINEVAYLIVLAFWVVAVSEGTITIIGNLNRVSRKGLKSAKSTEQFVKVTRNIESRMKIRWFIIFFLCGVIFLVSASYFILFSGFSGNPCKKSALWVFILSLFIDFLIYQPILAFILSLIKWKGFELKFLHKLDSIIYKFRIWKAMNPDYV
ncbi:unnamed protein product [Blepharisma stoltei]|uniref:Transmembrane protein n=1 Tax=Blepharisma stoltei TaxID=1481888 RepID=A0AAU9JE22_9CILI|nr:unnamed protein product [Blepharisma stoltei]